MKIDFTKMDRKNGRLMELAKDRVQWRAFVLATLSARVLLPQN